jgi:glycosyltransferase involved in cell wall biosynthesis
MGLPDILIEVLDELGVPYDWTIHDYYSICPRTHLVGVSGTYCGEPDTATCNRCLALLGDDQGRPVTMPIEAWRGRFARHLAGARRVFVPSEDARRRISRWFPSAAVVVRPHPERFAGFDGRIAPYRLGETIHVAVLGTITAVKGSQKLLDCARDARQRRLPLQFHVLGSTDRDAHLERLGNVNVMGRYREEDVRDCLAELRCELAFLPSVCPETFMFTLSIAMSARLFVICFDVGAQAERLRAWGWGRTLPVSSSPQAINNGLLAAARWLEPRPVPPPPAAAVYPDLLGAYYDLTPNELGTMGPLHQGATSG